MTVDVAENTRKAAKTKYLPRVDALAGYQHFSREISLLSDDQKNTLNNLGTNTFGQLGGQIGQNLSSWHSKVFLVHRWLSSLVSS